MIISMLSPNSMSAPVASRTAWQCLSFKGTVCNGDRCTSLARDTLIWGPQRDSQSGADWCTPAAVAQTGRQLFRWK